jgi:hypothetical protein
MDVVYNPFTSRYRSYLDFPVALFNLLIFSVVA